MDGQRDAMAMLRLILDGAPDGQGGPPASITPGEVPLTIGRDPGAGWCLPDPSRRLSGLHCTVARTERGFVLSDTSTNGTFVNGATERLDADHVLRDGDRIAIGPYTIRVALQTGADAPAIRPAAAAGPPPALPPILTPRGADPAAIAASGLQGASAAVGMTVIRPAPTRPPPAANRPEAAAAPTPADTAPQPSGAQERSRSSAMREALAHRLGVPSASLPARDDAELIGTLADVALGLAAAFREAAIEQNRLVRRLGARQWLIDRLGADDPLARSDTATDLVLDALSRPGAARALQAAARATVRRSCATADAVETAASALASLMGPDRLARLAPDGADPNRWLAAYARLWQDLDPDWREGFAEAFRLQWAEALDRNAPPAEDEA